jgi:large subunit ribosomal protein L16
MVFVGLKFGIITNLNMSFSKRKLFKKSRKLVSKGSETKVLDLKFGSFGLKALGNGRLTSKHIETARQAINRKIRPFGKMWVRVFADTPVSSIPSKVRMGKGKGTISYWACKVKKGQILYEISGVSILKSRNALSVGGSKLPFKIKIIQY